MKTESQKDTDIIKTATEKLVKDHPATVEPPTKTQFSFSLDRKEKEALEAAAEAKGITLTELFKFGAYLCANFDLDFWEELKEFRRKYGLAEYIVLQSFATIWRAHRDAEREAFPTLQSFRDREFLFTDKGPLPSKELYKLWRQIFDPEFQRKAKEAKGEKP